VADTDGRVVKTVPINASLTQNRSANTSQTRLQTSLADSHPIIWEQSILALQHTDVCGADGEVHLILAFRAVINSGRAGQTALVTRLAAFRDPNKASRTILETGVIHQVEPCGATETLR
jgi:hypothetical protein